MRRILACVSMVGLAGCGGQVPLSTYSMSSSSMDPTLREGDLVAANTLKGVCGQTRPEPGQLIVFRRSDGLFYISRAIAGPGHVVAVTQGRLSVDGRPVATSEAGSDAGPFGQPTKLIRETLANGSSYLTQDFGPDGDLDEYGPTVVKDGWFVMGDSRDNAADSRVKGPVPGADICGRIVRILFAKDKSRVGQAL
ncbi:MAG: signal peptidase I [Caulobacterales bacterium]|nr:signal peptidase I [Caulobacterales bacterium]